MTLTPYQAQLILPFVDACKRCGNPNFPISAQVTLWPEKGDQGALRFMIYPTIFVESDIRIPVNGDLPLLLTSSELREIAQTQ